MLNRRKLPETALKRAFVPGSSAFSFVFIFIYLFFSRKNNELTRSTVRIQRTIPLARECTDRGKNERPGRQK